MSKAPFRDTNLIDAATLNWRYVAYPLAVLAFLTFSGLAVYFYLLNSQSDQEAGARAAFLQATTPDAKLQVAHQFPGTDGGIQALLSAADDYFTAKDYSKALSTYQEVTRDYPHHELEDSAQLGLAASQEASGNQVDALTNYLAVARKGASSPYAPFGYNAAIRIYEQQGDKVKERQLLTEAAALDAQSPFSQEAAEKLKQLEAR